MGDHLAQLLTVDIQVSDQTDNRRGVNQYPLRLHKLAERRGLLFADANEQHVGIVTGDVGADSAQLLRHPRGVVMILLQALHVIFSAYSPAAARMPAWRIPPPTIFRQRTARRMYASLPSSSEPTGAPSPFDRQMVKESQYWAISRNSQP